MGATQERRASFVAMVKNGVTQTVKALREKHPTESLAGYALLTDDDLSTLLHLAITHEALKSASVEDLLFQPNDWPYEDGADAIEGAASEIRRLYSEAGGTNFSAHVDGAFGALVQAVAELKDENVFDADVFLCVGSTDPGPHLDKLETAAIARLNRPEFVRARHAFLERWGQLDRE